MKIVNKVGEHLPRWLATELRPILTVTGAGTALWAGSCILAGLGWTALDDHLDTWEKAGAFAAGVYVAGYGCWHAPHIAVFAVPGALLVWCVAAWTIAPAALLEETPVEQPDPAAPQAFTRWLTDLIGERPGIHLRDLYPAMRQLPGHEDRDNTQLRAALRTLDIPVRRSLRLGGVAGRSGVALADLEPLPSPPGEPGGEGGGDAGQPTDSPVGEQPSTGLESA